MSRVAVKSAIGDFVRHERKRGLLWGLVLVMTMQLVEFKGGLAGIEGKVIDLFLFYQPTSNRPAPIVTVEIDNESYRRCFPDGSPMDSVRLKHLLKELITGLDPARPLVMGIDIITDSLNDKDNYNRLRAFFTANELRTKMIWATAANSVKRTAPGFGQWLLGAEDEIQIEPSRTLGLTPDELDKRGIPWAPNVFVQDEDGRLRRFSRQIVQLPAGGRVSTGWRGEREYPTWTWRIAAEYCLWNGCKTSGDRREFIVSPSIQFLGQFSLRDLVQCDATVAVLPNVDKPMMRVFQDLVRDHRQHPIVLVGGTFTQSNDFYRTSNGLVPGMIISSYGLQAELFGEGIVELPRWATIVLDLVVSVLIVVFFYQGGTAQRIIAKSLSVVPLTVLLSFLTFRFGYLWLSCIGVAVGYMPHIILETLLANPTFPRKGNRRSRR